MSDAISTENTMGNVSIPVLTDEMVETAAEALAESGLWPKPDEHVQEFKERTARAILIAVGLPALLEAVAETHRGEPIAPLFTYEQMLEKLDRLERIVNGVSAALLQGGQTANIRCRGALLALEHA